RIKEFLDNTSYVSTYGFVDNTGLDRDTSWKELSEAIVQNEDVVNLEICEFHHERWLEPYFVHQNHLQRMEAGACCPDYPETNVNSIQSLEELVIYNCPLLDMSD